VCPIKFPPIPAETAQTVGTVFGQANLMLAIADRSQQLFSDLKLGRYSKSPETAMRWFFRPALTTIFQFIEDLPDRRAAEATRTRMEWKYALRLPLNHPGLDHSLLCEFRRRLLLDAESREGFQEMLARLHAADLLGGKRASPWVADHVRATVCDLSRVELAVLRMYQVLDVMTTRKPEWLHQFALLGWYGRYSKYLTQPMSSSPQEQADLVKEIGSDIFCLLEAVGQGEMNDLTLSPEIQSLHQVWSQNFELQAGEAKWRRQGCFSCI
jgi:transposase